MVVGKMLCHCLILGALLASLVSSVDDDKQHTPPSLDDNMAEQIPTGRVEPSAPPLSQLPVKQTTRNVAFTPGQYVVQSQNGGYGHFKYVSYRASLFKWRNQGATYGAYAGVANAAFWGPFYLLTGSASHAIVGTVIVSTTCILGGVVSGMVVAVTAGVLLRRKSLVLSRKRPVQWTLDDVGDGQNGFTLRTYVGSEKYITESGLFRHRATKLDQRRRIVFHAQRARGGRVYLQLTTSRNKTRWLYAQGSKTVLLHRTKKSKWKLHPIAE